MTVVLGTEDALRNRVAVLEEYLDAEFEKSRWRYQKAVARWPSKNGIKTMHERSDHLFSTSVDIRFSDEDNMGHVHHEAIVGYIAHARVTFIDELVKRSGVKDIDYVLVNLNVDFLGEVNHPGVVDVSSWVERIGNKSVTTKYELFKGGGKFAKAISVNVFFNTKSKETVPIPDTLGEILSDHLEP